jgi:hypothetical protein
MIDGAVKLMRVYERKTKAGTRYFVGVMGQARVLIKRDDDADLTDGTIGVWDVFLKDRDDQPSQTRASSTPKPTTTGRKPCVRARAGARPTTTSKDSVNKRAAEINQRLAHVSLNDDLPPDL